MISESTVKLLISEDGIATVTLSRPHVANALNSQMALELKDVFATLNSKANVRAVILTGDGKRAFCAGADLKERKGMTVEAWQVQHQQFRHSLNSIMNCQVPVIAAINGAAYGGGLELALACDFIYSSKTAYFAFPEVTLGIIPGMGGTQTMPRAVGLRRAKELLLTGKAFSAADAYSWGMVNMLCEPDELVDYVNDCAQAISRAAPLSVNAIKRVSTHSIHMRLDEALAAESSYYNRLLSTKDRSEGIAAFNEKRKPDFTGK